METDGGGWTVVQRRQDGSVNFYRNWKAYKKGFGSPSGEFWLGLENLHQMTKSKSFELRIDVISRSRNQHFYAKYSNVRVSGERDGYRLRLGKYTGAFNLIGHENGMKFSTYDRDNDAYSGHCASLYKGAWWYGGCYRTNGNGKYAGQGPTALVVYELYTRGKFAPLRFMEMKVRPM